MRKLTLTLGETGTQETRNLSDQGVRGKESIVLACELLDELLVLVELLQVVRGHGIDAEMLSTVDIMLVTENAISKITNSSQHFTLSCICSIVVSLKRTRCSFLGEERLAA